MNRKSLLFLLLLPVTLLAADYQGYQYELFFERQPSARAHGLGQSLTALNDGAFTAFYNPAGIISNAGSFAGYSETSPYYFQNDASYKYWGLTHELEDIATIGFNRYYVTLDDPTLPVTIEGERQKQETSLFTLSFARIIAKNLSLGLNVNMYYHHTAQKENYFSWPIDVGLLRTFKLVEEGNPQNLSLGMVLKNINGAKVKEQAYYYESGVLNGILPTIFRVGAAWEKVFYTQSLMPEYLLPGITLTAEYENVLNSPSQSGFRGGAEFSFVDMAFARIGYYSYNLDTKFTGGKDSISDLTYGIGLKIALDQFVEKEFPMIVRADYVQMVQPSYKNSLENAEFGTLCLQVQWMY